MTGLLSSKCNENSRKFMSCPCLSQGYKDNITVVMCIGTSVTHKIQSQTGCCSVTLLSAVLTSLTWSS